MRAMWGKMILDKYKAPKVELCLARIQNIEVPTEVAVL